MTKETDIDLIRNYLEKWHLLLKVLKALSTLPIF